MATGPHEGAAQKHSNGSRLSSSAKGLHVHEDLLSGASLGWSVVSFCFCMTGRSSETQAWTHDIILAARRTANDLFFHATKSGGPTKTAMRSSSISRCFMGRIRQWSGIRKHPSHGPCYQACCGSPGCQKEAPGSECEPECRVDARHMRL